MTRKQLVYLSRGAGAAALLGIVMMYPRFIPSVQILGFWLLAGALIGFVAYLAFALLRRMVGRPEDDWTGDRELAIAVSILVASALAPGAARDVEGVVIGLARGLFVESPQLAAADAQGHKRRGQVISGLYRCIVDRRECVAERAAAAAEAKAAADAKAAAEKAGRGDAQAAAAPSKQDAKSSMGGDPVPPDVDWVLFLLVLFGMIMAARGLRGARYDHFIRPRKETEAAAARAAGRVTPPAEPGAEPRGLPGRSQVLMNYPTWVAFCVYALILLPATYLAIGSLLFLRMEAPSANLAALTRTLSEAQARVATPPFDLTRLRAGLVRLESPGVVALWDTDSGAGDAGDAPAAGPGTTTAAPTEEVVLPRSVVAAGRQLADDAESLEIWVRTARESYERKVLEAAAEAKVQVTAPQFEDGREVQVASYESELADLAKKLQDCRDGLGGVQAQQELVSAKLNRKRGADPKSEERPDLKALDTAVRGAQPACKQTSETPTPPVWVGVSRPSGARSREKNEPPQFLEALYGWLASTSDSAVLIVGLVGFGLFGSAIRMMARPDAPNVKPEDVTKAHEAAVATRAAATKPWEEREAARIEKEAAQHKLEEATRRREAEAAGVAQTEFTNAAAAFGTADALWREADEHARLAEAYYDQQRRSLVEDRSSIVVREASGDYTISGAPAKVLVQGVGAAFTSFLAGQAGLQVLSMGGRANAYTLLLTCFVGAVFAEEIWRWARRFLPNGGAAPPPPPPPEAGK